MDKRVLEFLAKNRVCALTTLLSDGSPHAAALHFSHKDEPLTLYFSTENTSRKTGALLSGEIGKASVVVGFDEKEMVTVQMDGEVRVVLDKSELVEVHKIHYSKHPEAEKWKDDPATIFLAFTPTWWRYTDYKTKPLTILASEK